MSIGILLAACATPGRERALSHPVQNADLGLAAARPGAPRLEEERWWQTLGDAQLASLIEAALAGSPDIRTAEARVRRAEELQTIARGSARPGLDVNAHATREQFSGTYLFPPPLGGSWLTDTRATLDFELDFDFWHRHDAEIAASSMRGRAAQAQALASRLVLSVAIASAYAELQSDFEALSLARERERAEQRLVAVTEEAVKRGITPGSLVEPGLRTLSGSREEIAAIESRIRLLQNELAALSGKAPGVWQDVAHVQLAAPRGMLEPKALPADFLGRRPDIVAQQYLVEASLEDVAVARTDFYPNVNLLAFVGVQSIGLDQLLDAKSRTLGAGPAVHLPLFSQGTLRAKLGSRYAEYDMAVEGYNRTVLDAAREVADRGAELESAATRIAMANESLASLQRSAHASEVRRSRGLSGDREVLENRLAVLDQSGKIAALRSAQLRSAFGLIKALGGVYGGAALPAAGPRKDS